MVEFIEIEEAKERRGLRLVTVGGVPSPWSEAAKGILQLKGIPYVALRMPPGENAVTEWTGSASAPVAVLDDEPPRSGWAEILLLAERLAPEPRLIPADPDERALLFGLSHEICGEMGLAWCRRLELIQSGLDSGGERGFPPAIGRYLAPKYGFRPRCAPEARARMLDVLKMLGRRLARQAERAAATTWATRSRRSTCTRRRSWRCSGRFRPSTARFRRRCAGPSSRRTRRSTPHSTGGSSRIAISCTPSIWSCRSRYEFSQ